MRVLVLLGLVVLFSGLATYMAVGHPRLLVSVAPQAAPAGEPQAGEGAGPDPEQVAALQRQLQDVDQAQVQDTIAGMVANLRTRLEVGGGSAEEWDRLVRSYATLQDLDGLTFALNGLLNLQPENPQALLLAGQVAAQQGDRSAAKAFFMRLLHLIDPDHPRFEQIRTLIESFDQTEPDDTEN